ncbi:hypothetical protein LCGC14_0831890 [marine sediment metagenome]|uniref:Uncharacterized protein n=1 Tax=marine sediment metagenome TaxID=412755 RepID=A0A0F9PFR0_9ZZZZ
MNDCEYYCPDDCDQCEVRRVLDDRADDNGAFEYSRREDIKGEREYGR